MIQRGCVCGSGDDPRTCCNMVSVDDVLEIINNVEELEGDMPDSTYDLILKVSTDKMAFAEFLRNCIKVVKNEIRNEVLALNS